MLTTPQSSLRFHPSNQAQPLFSSFFLLPHVEIRRRSMRSSRIQYSRIALYWAPLTLGLSIVWSMSLNLLRLTGILPAFSLAIPAIIAIPIALALYFIRDNQELEYDDFGFHLKKGRNEVDTRKWNELQEASIIKDNYGRVKVRMYIERNGNHYDVDCNASGVNPYVLRNFASSRICSRALDETSLDLFGGLEREIQKGRASWVADLKETFIEYQISGATIPLFARGSTRPSGFILSRLAAYTIMPNYDVCMYADRLGVTDAKAQILRLIRIIETQRDQRNIRWSWLLLFGDQPPPDSVDRIIRGFRNRDIGLGYIDTMTGEMSTSPNQLGRSMSNQMNLKRLMRDLRSRYGV